MSILCEDDFDIYRGVTSRALRPPPYHPGLPRIGCIYTRAPARWEDSRAIEPYRILEAGASLGLPERPEMRDTLLFSIQKTHLAPRSSYSRIPTFVRTKSRRASASQHTFSPCFTNVPHVFAGYVGPVSLRNFNNNKAEVLRYSLWCVT